jgi:lipopolysaccharide export system permease protein
MFSILDKYLIKQYLLYLLLIFAIVAGLLFIFDFIELTRITTSKNVPINKVLIMSAQKNPMHVQKIFGFLVLLASMLTYMRMSKSNELTIFKAAGLSVYQYLIPVIICGFILGTIYALAINPLTSGLVSNYLRNEANYLKGNPSLLAISKTGLWIKQVDAGGVESIIHAFRIGKNHKRLHEVTFYFLDKDKSFVKRIDADTADFEGNAWKISKAQQTSENKLNDPVIDIIIPTNITFEQIQESLVPPESLSFWKLPTFISIAENSGLSVTKHKLYFYRLLISPIFFISMVILGAAFSMSPPRFGKGNRMLVTVLMIGFFIYFFSDLIFAFASAGNIPIWLGASSPTIISLAIGILIILHYEEAKS